MKDNRWNNKVGTWRRKWNRQTKKHYVYYIGFVLLVTLISILAAERSSYGKLRMWYYNLTKVKTRETATLNNCSKTSYEASRHYSE